MNNINNTLAKFEEKTSNKGRNREQKKIVVFYFDKIALFYKK